MNKEQCPEGGKGMNWGITAELKKENMCGCRDINLNRPVCGVWVVMACGEDGEPKEWVRAVTTRSKLRIYANVWVFSKAFTSVGSGWAGGCGYHKASAAVGDAIDNAGIELSSDVRGRGDGAITEALYAIAKAAGAKSPKCFEII